MRSAFIAVLIYFLPCLSNAQGIQFEQPFNMEQVLAKAKAENKYVFIDCFTTWCGPCKYMDDSIFSKKSVGDFFTQNFINGRLQMDTSKKDNEETKELYQLAHELMTKYRVKSFPTYLFFAPDGSIVHRDAGAFSSEMQFIEAAKNSMKPEKQYYHLMQLFNASTIDAAQLKTLALVAREVEEQNIATAIGNKYVQAVQDNLSKDNLVTIGKITKSSRDAGFDLYLNHTTAVNDIMGKYYAERKVMNIIMEENKYVIDAKKRSEEGKVITGYVNGQPVFDNSSKSKSASTKDPDWNMMKKSIGYQYGSYYGDRVTKWIKIFYYKQKEKWNQYVESMINYVEPYYDDVKIGQLNEFAFEIFTHSNRKDELEKARAWSKQTVDSGANDVFLFSYLDTYANLLYKLGYRSEAIAFEERAVQLSEGDYKEAFAQTLQKIRNGQKTWN